jgi:hypothetical protein
MPMKQGTALCPMTYKPIHRVIKPSELKSARKFQIETKKYAESKEINSINKSQSK